LYFIVGVVLDLEQPFVEVFETVTFGEVEDEEGGDGALVVGAGDGLEGLLSCLNGVGVTVSQICILMLRLSMLIFLEPNSTPRVG
jgi:hypothetical protein